MNAPSRPNKQAPAPAEKKIREYASRLSEQIGRLPGRDWDDWLRAEAELAKAVASAEAPIPKKWRWHYHTLAHIRETLLRERDEHDASLRTPLSRGGVDAADVASNESEHDVLVAELAIEYAEIAEIEAALVRIRTETYGICEATGVPIAAARLRAVPWARSNVVHSPISRAGILITEKAPATLRSGAGRLSPTFSVGPEVKGPVAEPGATGGAAKAPTVARACA